MRIEKGLERRELEEGMRKLGPNLRIAYYRVSNRRSLWPERARAAYKPHSIFLQCHFETADSWYESVRSLYCVY